MESCEISSATNVISGIALSSDVMNMNSFSDRLHEENGRTPETRGIHTFQVNVGNLCNQECHHCHHMAGPDREEVMTWETMKDIIDKAKRANIPTIDITGGAPEMNPNIRRFIAELKSNGHHVIFRTNLTAFQEEGLEDLPEFFRDNELELIASMPCFTCDNVDAMRGDGVFQGSIRGLRILNELGYGREEDLKLNLIFNNPEGDFLPPPQKALKEEFQHHLRENFGIVFFFFFAIANMPVGRYLKDLKKRGKDQEYMKLLEDSFNPDTIDNLMCLYQINIGWDGKLYDCDFNLAIGLTTVDDFPSHISELDPTRIKKREVNTGEHCFGCTAGAGSSCGGSLTD